MKIQTCRLHRFAPRAKKPNFFAVALSYQGLDDSACQMVRVLCRAHHAYLRIRKVQTHRIPISEARFVHHSVGLFCCMVRCFKRVLKDMGWIGHAFIVTNAWRLVQTSAARVLPRKRYTGGRLCVKLMR